MTSTGKITKQDVARYLNGDIEDLAALDRIEQALVDDPQAQQWFSELDLESLLPDDEDELPGLLDSPEAARIRAHFARLEETELWRVDLAVPLGELTAIDSETSGTLTRAAGSQLEQLACIIRRTSDDPVGFVLELVDQSWPYDYWPIQLVVGHLSVQTLTRTQENASQEPIVVSLPGLRRALDEAGGRSPADKRAPGQAKADPPTPAQLHADDNAKEHSVSDISGECGPFRWTLVEGEGRCRVEVRCPTALPRDEELAVVELTYQRGDDQIRSTLASVVRLTGGPTATTWMGNAVFRPLDDASDCNIEVGVRPLNEDDLPMLAPRRVAHLLSEQDVLGLSIQPGPNENSLQFNLRWPGQEQRLAKELASSRKLHLRVCQPAEED